MQSLFENFNKNLAPDFFQSELLENLSSFPCYITAKDRNGRFIFVNDFMAQDLNFNQGKDLFNVSMYDIWTHESAEQHKTIDEKVMSQNCPLTIYEQAENIKKNMRVIAVSSKAPLVSRSKKIIGSTCISLILKKEMIINDNQSIQDEDLENTLTLRQKECLYLLVTGMSAKQIASEMHIATKTVEHHLEHIKNKLNCHIRYELIKKALEFSYIKFKLLFS